MLHAQDITLYSGRGETLVKPIIEQFEKQSGIKVNVRYGDTAQLAVLLQEEGARSPADVYWGQDAGAMGALANAGLLATLPEAVYKQLPEIYTSKTGQWVAASGRSRVIAYSTERASAEDIPASVFDLTSENTKAVLVSHQPTGASSHSLQRCEYNMVTRKPWRG